MLKNLFGWFRKSTNTEHEVISDDSDDDCYDEDDLLREEQNDVITVEDERNASTPSVNDDDDVEIQVMVEDEEVPHESIEDHEDSHQSGAGPSSGNESGDEERRGPVDTSSETIEDKEKCSQSGDLSNQTSRGIDIVDERSEVAVPGSGPGHVKEGSEELMLNRHSEEKEAEENNIENYVVENGSQEEFYDTPMDASSSEDALIDQSQSPREEGSQESKVAEKGMEEKIPSTGNSEGEKLMSSNTENTSNEEAVMVTLAAHKNSLKENYVEHIDRAKQTNTSIRMEEVMENEFDEDENMEPKASSSSAEKILKETEKLSKTISMTSKKLRSSSRLTKELEEVTKSKELEMEEEEVETSSPGEPCEVSATSSSITLAWEPPKQGYENIEYYEVKYRENGRKRKRWTSCFTDDRKETFTINDLIGDTKYEFKVRAIMEGEVEGPFSETSNAMKTRFSLAKQIASQYETIKIRHGPPIVYKVPVREILGARNRATMTRKCIFGQPDPSAMEKTIMMVGATGAGKSTLIDGMINYITDVSWEDDFRFSILDLMEDELKKKGNEANSQTEWITSYTVNHKPGSPVDYTLNIIDTPGFGDTRGLQRDKKIVDQIRGFFETPGENGVTGIDAVCFVTQAPLARLTPPQKYIFDAILSVFGADIASNIFVLITFADGHDPPVRAALEEAKVPFAKSFKFNNSALFSSTADAEEVVFGKMFWSMGKESFKKFFDELGRVEQRSLWMTNKVLQLRQRLEATIQGLQPQIEEGLNQLNTIRQEQEVLRRHKAEIEANKNFTYEVEEIHAYQEPTDPGTFITNCLKCNRTCHYPCRIPDDDGKKKCLSIDPNVLTCMVCPQRCHWSLHKNNDFRYVTYTMKIQKTYEQLKEKYNVAQDQERKTRDVLMKVKESFREMGKQVTKNVSDVRRCINQLNEIALRPNPLTDLDYINILIENEKNEKKYGWESRVELYQKARKEAELVKKAGEQDFSPWEDVDDVLQDE